MNLKIMHLIIFSGFLVVSGLVHGVCSNRWSSLAGGEGKDLLENLDGDVGDWRPGDVLCINPAEIAEKTVCHSRRFMPLKLGQPMVVSVTSGGPGVVAVHTPDVCYLGAGYKLKGEVSRQEISFGDDGKIASFWTADFIKTTALGSESVRVRWSWTADGKWEAPDYPRLEYARVQMLYKLYIVQPLSEDDNFSRGDPYRKFIADLIPRLNRQL